MIKHIIKIYQNLYNKNRENHYKKRNYILWLYCNIGYRLMAILLFLCLQSLDLFNRNSKLVNGENDIVVSLTSFPSRINGIWMTIESIMRQEVRPSKIELYLSINEFPNKFNDLPKNLKQYINNGLEVFFVEDNLMPHKKYIYAFKKYRENNSNVDKIITVDDDVYYMPNMISNLIDLNKKFSDCVCASVTHHIQLDKPYNQWSNDSNSEFPSHEYIAIGIGGVLYPIKQFNDDRMYDEKEIKKLCLRADDLWLKAFEIVNDIRVVTHSGKTSYVNLIGTQKHSLKKTNTSEKADINNDTQWELICKRLNINISNYLKQ